MKYNISLFFFCFLVIIVRIEERKKSSVTVPNDCSWSNPYVCVCCFCYTHSCIEYYISRSYFVLFLFLFFFLAVHSFVIIKRAKSFVSTFLSLFSFPFWLFVEFLIGHHGWIIKRIGFTWHGSTEWNCLCVQCFLYIEPPHQPSKKKNQVPRALFS
jgi:hypothetical protein